MNGPQSSALPVQLTSFVGRQREIETVRDLLASSRLLTLTGAGGIGKTRLALEVAARVALDTDESPVFVELATVTDPARVPDAIADMVGIPEQPGRTAATALADALHARPLLLILDNCEHVVDACAALSDTLLRACPHLRILATSREALGIGGELAWLVPPLSMPSLPSPDTAAAIEEAEAVQLFVQRACDVRPHFDLSDMNAAAVAQICRRLDGIPLAIELAAGRLRALTPEAIAQRLDDRFALLTGGSRTVLPRQQTLRATIDWSYDLLTAEHRHLLDRLSVFAGGFELEAAEAVCTGEEIVGGAVLDLLSGLVERSLVELVEHGGDARYRLLETVRQYAAERLDARGEAELVRRRHAHFFAKLVETAEGYFITRDRPRWIEAVDRDFDNVRQTLAWAREHDPVLELRVAGWLCWYWFSTERWSEGRRWLEPALAHPVAPTRDWSAAAVAAGAIACLQGDSAAARPWLEEALRIADSLGDGRLAAYARNYLGMNYAFEGRPEGEAFTQQAIDWFLDDGDLYGLRLGYLVLGTYQQRADRSDEALRTIERGVEAARAFGLDRELGIALQHLGALVLQQGDIDRAAGLLRESLAALDRDPHPLFIARGLTLYGFMLCDRGASAEGVRYFGAADVLREGIAAAVFATDRPELEARLAAAGTALGEEAVARARAEGRCRSVRSLIAAALADGNGSTWRSGEPPGRNAAPPASAHHTSAASTVEVPVVPEARPALRVRALGPLEIQLDGVVLGADAWSHSRPRDILLYLLCHPGGRTRDQIGLAFWPDASAAQVKNRFHVALHHLRKTLGRADWVRHENGRYRLHPELDCEFDAAVFEEGARSALLDVRSGRTAADRLDAALALYRGDFLEAERVGEWHCDHRDRLRRLHSDLLSARGDHLMATGAYAHAVELYLRLLRQEDLDEDAHRRLMICLARLGERGRALRHYETLVELLRNEVDAEPESETVELYLRLQRAEPV